MPILHPRLFVAGFLTAALIAGCGGGGTATGNGNGNSNGNGNGNGGGNSTVEVYIFGAPTVVAAKIGTGAFTPQTLNGSILTLSIPSGSSNYAVAYLCSSNGENYEYVWEASVSDGASPMLICPSGGSYPPSNQMGLLTGSVDGSALPELPEMIDVYSVNSSNTLECYAQSQGSSTISLNCSAMAGNDRILVLAIDVQRDIIAAKSFENQTVPGALNGGNTVALGTADALASEPITYNNIPSGFDPPQAYVSLDLLIRP